jgi:hypothetical protein
MKVSSMKRKGKAHVIHTEHTILIKVVDEQTVPGTNRRAYTYFPINFTSLALLIIYLGNDFKIQ